MNLCLQQYYQKKEANKTVEPIKCTNMVWINYNVLLKQINLENSSNMMLCSFYTILINYFLNLAFRSYSWETFAKSELYYLHNNSIWCDQLPHLFIL
jgi:hypothetical protein